MRATFVLSAASASDFPATGLPEVAFVGRSNVGKSSLLNALVRTQIARTSAAPGKTRLANYYLIESRKPGPGSAPSLYLVDLPGYGYARGGADAAAEFEALAAQYFDPGTGPRRRLCGVMHLVDSRHPDLAQDAAAHEWLRRTGVPLAVVATKIDKLTQSQKMKTLRSMESSYGPLVCPASTLDGTGLDEIWKTVRRWCA